MIMYKVPSHKSDRRMLKKAHNIKLKIFPARPKINY